MSMSQNQSTNTNTFTAAGASKAEAERLWWALAVARYVRQRREQLGQSVGHAAELAGLELSQWLALEEGWVPEELSVIVAVATTLQVRWSDLDLVALFARAAQQRGA